jgi:hypothetical protein
MRRTVGRLVASLGVISVFVACSSSDDKTGTQAAPTIGAICPTNPACAAIALNGTAFPTTVDEATWEECGTCEYNVLISACVQSAGGSLPTPYLSIDPAVGPEGPECFLAALLLCQEQNGYYASTPADLTGDALVGICAQAGLGDCLNRAVSTANGVTSCPAITTVNPIVDDGGVTSCYSASEGLCYLGSHAASGPCTSIDPGEQVAVTTCPMTNLVGCCEYPAAYAALAGASKETCTYNVADGTTALPGLMAACVGVGGTWVPGPPSTADGSVDGGAAADATADATVDASIGADVTVEDAGAPDAPAFDATMDASTNDGAVDAARPDATAPDAGTPDAGSHDAAVEAGAPDAGSQDAAAQDAGPPDAEAADAGSQDAGAPDGEADDAASSDAPDDADDGGTLSDAEPE